VRKAFECILFCMPRPPRDHGSVSPSPAAALPRIIGGTLRGRRLEYAAEPATAGGAARTRPMKDRVREMLFDLLGPAVKGTTAIDLFAGTGALGFEAISRGAARAVFCERHFPTADALRRSAKALEIADRVEVRPGDALVWAQRLPPLPTDAAWLVFIAPPWELFQSRTADLVGLIAALRAAAPAGSFIVVESDTAFDAAALPEAAAWRTRPAAPAVLHILGPLVS
jgi:16S rRNA (guanine966-N2)-methyltransferase